MNKLATTLLGLTFLISIHCVSEGKNSVKIDVQKERHAEFTKLKNSPDSKITKTNEEWKNLLNKEQFHIMRKKGTERAFTGHYNDFKGKGVFLCAGCGQNLFDSEAKFDSGTGWPSYYQPVKDKNISLEADNSLFTSRTEVLCSRCGAHLGHVFEDGPAPTGLRYCINSRSLTFEAKTK